MWVESGKSLFLIDCVKKYLCFQANFLFLQILFKNNFKPYFEGNVFLVHWLFVQ